MVAMFEKKEQGDFFGVKSFHGLVRLPATKAMPFRSGGQDSGIGASVRKERKEQGDIFGVTSFQRLGWLCSPGATSLSFRPAGLVFNSGWWHLEESAFLSRQNCFHTTCFIPHILRHQKDPKKNLLQ